MENVNIQYKELLRKILDEGFEYTDKSRGVQRKQITSTTLNIDLKQGFPAINLKELYWKGIVGELIWFLNGDTNIKYLVDNNIHIWDKDAYNYHCKVSDNTIGKDEFKVKYDEFVNHIKTGNKQKVIAGSNYKFGELGRVYGSQWRNWFNPEYRTHGYIDQISNVIKGLRENPMGTKHLVTAWNPAELNDMALPPCHWSFEILVEPIKCTSNYCYKNEGCEKTCCKDEPQYQFTLKWHQRSVDTFLGQM